VAEHAEIPVWFADSDDAVVATLHVGADAAWVVETYPCTVIEERADGSFQIQIAINSEHWLGRLLLRAGGAVTVLAPAELVGLQQSTAAKVLASYANKL
jgi:predicted DNA-binding transcriptional regulator YafY